MTAWPAELLQHEGREHGVRIGDTDRILEFLLVNEHAGARRTRSAGRDRGKGTEAQGECPLRDVSSAAFRICTRTLSCF